MSSPKFLTLSDIFKLTLQNFQKSPYNSSLFHSRSGSLHSTISVDLSGGVQIIIICDELHIYDERATSLSFYRFNIASPVYHMIV